MFRKGSIVILLLWMLVSPMLAMGEFVGGVGDQAIYIIDPDLSGARVLQDQELQKEIWLVCQKEAYTQIVLRLDQLPLTLYAPLAKFIKKAHQEEIKVVLLTGKPEWTYDHTPALMWLKSYQSYHESHPADEQIDGIVWLIEPQYLALWPDRQEVLVEHYLNLLQKIEYQLSYAGIQVPRQVAMSEELLSYCTNREIMKRLDGVLLVSDLEPIMKDEGLTGQ